MKHLLISLILVSIFSSCIHSQTDSTSYILPEFRLFQNSKKIEETYYFKKDLNKLILYNDTLFADPSVYKYKVGLNRINKVSFRDGTYSVPGFVYGAAGGFILGFIGGITIPSNAGNGALAKDKFELAMILGVVFALVTGGIGSLVGLMTPRYEDYDLHKSDIAKKRSGLKKVFEYWKISKK